MTEPEYHEVEIDGETVIYEQFYDNLERKVRGKLRDEEELKLDPLDPEEELEVKDLLEKKIVDGETNNQGAGPVTFEYERSLNGEEISQDRVRPKYSKVT
jgi:hypothetical protein